MRNLQIKTLLEKDATLNFPVWHKNGTQEAFLMHVTAVLDTIKKRGHFKGYKKAEKAYVEHKQAVESAKVGLALLDETVQGKRIARRRHLQRPRKPQRKPLQRSQIPSQKPRRLKKHPR